MGRTRLVRVIPHQVALIINSIGKSATCPGHVNGRELRALLEEAMKDGASILKVARYIAGAFIPIASVPNSMGSGGAPGTVKNEYFPFQIQPTALLEALRLPREAEPTAMP